MKRFYIIIAIFCCFVTAANAQFGTGGGSTTVGKISGTLIDSVTKKPMDYASVGLYRSGGKAPITGVVTDEKGNFKLDNVHPGSYKLAITFIGYPTKVVDPVVTTDSKPDKNLGIVIVSPGARTLKEVTVTGQKALVENHIDKLVYNVEKDLTAAGGNASDVLQKVPLVAVDINGNVSVRGDGNVRVLINGKPSGATAASLSDLLKAIPADQIKSIEVITNPSAKYDAEGTAGIINIVTKQTNMTGLSGSVSGGFGTRQNNGNANINYTKNRLTLSANFGGNFTWPQTSITQFNQDFHPDSASHTTQSSYGTSRVKRYSFLGSFTVGYDFNKYNNITSTFRVTDGTFNTNATSMNVKEDFFEQADNYTYTSNTLGHNSFGGFDWNIDYTHKFHKEGEEISLSTQWSHSSIVTNYTTIFSSVFANQEDNIDGVNNEYTVQLDYTLPINKVLKLEAGGKEIIRRINSTSNVFSPDSTGTLVFDPINSNLYNYNQNVSAGYGVLTVTMPKSYTVLAGARLENTDIHGDPINASEALSPFSQNYNTFIPSLTLQKALTSTQTLKLSYSKRITRPSLQYLNPFLNKSNILSQSVGNPTLGPETSQTVELNYNTFIKSSVINFSVYYKHNDGLIQNITTIIPVSEGAAGDITPATLSKYYNIGTNNSFGASFFGSINPIKILTIRGSINAFTFDPTVYPQFSQFQTQTDVRISYNAFLSGSVTLNNGFIAELFAVENSPRYTIQGSNPAFSILGAGVRKQIFNKKASIGINTIEPFSKYKDFNSSTTSPGFSQTSKFEFPFRSVGLTFSYTFGKVSFSNPQQQKKGLNDDQKQGDQGGIGGQ
ncbi:TonB-dependent receptor domain-containing protein [Mucilaginibacter sp. X4EP1]|uniref:TonB-dependent receptor domain-containing protein n=1 Tax=Mucilaginibacter sp. X4EP1 TaxID=2723092 RepID=UPI0021695C1A|nr:TonB-dependent receptor [Mucilaginibacter sp. X4EP1]MCS3816338.1 outer membrane receptor protein involved in Fe transport [Mucilaginibacter sp. X4EP1]